MKKILILTGILLFSYISVFSQEYYYWSSGKKNPLELHPAKSYIALCSENTNNINNINSKSKLAGILGVSKEKFTEFTTTTISQIIEKTQSSSNMKSVRWSIVSEKVTKNMVHKNSDILYTAPFFQINGNDIGVSNFFYVKLHEVGDFNLLEQMAEENNVEIVGRDSYMPLWYVLSCDKNSKGNALEMANLFYESKIFAHSQPDFLVDFSINCVDDAFFNDHWHLNNTGQYNGSISNDIRICNAWDITNGCQNITVAVLDNGLELNHPDLNIAPVSFDTHTGTQPSIVRGDHGVAVAGIIGANANNAIGVAGVAPECPLMSISENLLLAPGISQRLASGINFAWQNGADVINNSWGSNNLPDQQLITDAIQN